jgi:DNA-binding NarL/FixJ family response regulator
MPGKNGIELLGLIRADQRLAKVPVVLLTAKAMAQDRVQGYKAGADAYLPKPFDPDELLSIVDNLITRQHQMSGKSGELMDLKEDMEKIKQIMKRNSANVVKKTDIYLTDMEREVLELLCKGFTNAEIADERSVSIIGINRVIQKLYLKTETRNRTELVRWAMTTGYVSSRM